MTLDDFKRFCFDFGRFCMTLNDFGRCWNTLNDSKQLWTTFDVSVSGMKLSMLPSIRSRRAVPNGGPHLSVAYV